jgi:hypothetical protein
MYAFLALIVILSILFIAAKTTSRESFVGEVPLNTKTNVILPMDKVVAPSSLPVSEEANYFNPLPSDLPGPLPIAPYQQIGSNLPSPYKEPSLIKTTRQRILNSLETVKAFLAFQAQELDDKSDPSIQLPLQTARGDFKRLESEANVLQRNPGLTPQMTVLDIAQIEDNLAYLQREAELIGVNRPFQSSSHDADLEGFEEQVPAASVPASLSQLNDFSARIETAIQKLGQSGTTDPIIQARIGNLTKMKTDVDTVIQKLNSKALLPANVPIMESDVKNALPALGDVTKSLPNVIQDIKNDNYGDGSVMNTIAKFLTSYGPQIIENSSLKLDLSMGYSPQQQHQANSKVPGQKRSKGQSTLADTGFPSNADLDSVASGSDMYSMAEGNEMGNADATDPYAMDPRAEGRSVAQERLFPMNKNPSAPFDWKQRVGDIIGQIQKREMNPADFGAMPATTKVSDQFSWKGYAKMICTRLMAAEPNRLDEMCGCPPSEWKGWGV